MNKLLDGKYFINGEIIEQFGVDLGITPYQITGVNWFKLGFKYIAYREAIEEPEFWEEMNEYAGGGEIEDWMQSALYQLQAEEDNDNLQISYVKNKYSAKEVIIKNTVSEKIKGGVVIKVGDEILDGSVERKLKELKILLIS